MNHDFWQLTGALVAGGGIGLFFFGGLWLTLKRIPASRNPHLLLMGSFFARLGVVLAAFYALVPWGWEAMAVAMAGMLIARHLLVKRKGLARGVKTEPTGS